MITFIEKKKTPIEFGRVCVREGTNRKINDKEPREFSSAFEKVVKNLKPNQKVCAFEFYPLTMQQYCMDHGIEYQIVHGKKVPPGWSLINHAKFNDKICHSLHRWMKEYNEKNKKNNFPFDVTESGKTDYGRKTILFTIDDQEKFIDYCTSNEAKDFNVLNDLHPKKRKAEEEPKTPARLKFFVGSKNTPSSNSMTHPAAPEKTASNEVLEHRSKQIMLQKERLEQIQKQLPEPEACDSDEKIEKIEERETPACSL